MDMVVIFLFSINLLIAQSLFEENESGLDLFWKSIVRMLISMLGGVFLGKWLLPTLIWGWRDMAVSQLSTQVQITKKHKAYVEKTQNVLFLALCLTLFVLELYADDYLEPLLMCMIAGLIIANYTPYRQAFVHIMHAVQDYVFVAFFTLTGAALDFSSIGSTILLSFLLLIIRVLGIFIASYFGGQLSGENPKHNRVAWLAYVTQAGVALGLAKKVHLLYPDWGSDFATVIVSVVIINQLVGPPMFKWVIRHVGEANATLKVEGSAVIFTSLADDSTDADSVATVLGSHMWNVSTVHVTSLVLASEMIQEKERQRGGRDGGGTEGAMEMDVEGGEGGKNGLRLNSPSLASTPSHEGGDIQLDLHNIHNTNTNTHDNSTSTRDSLSDEKNHVSSTSSTPMPTLSHSLSSRSLSSLPADEINERISDDAILDSITGFTSCVIVLLDPNHALAARVAQLASQKCPEANLIVRASSSSASLSASSSSPTAPSHQGVSQAIKYSDAATGGEAELEAQGSDIDVDVDVDADNSGSEYPHVRHRTTNAGNDSVDHNAHSHTTNDSDAKHSGDSDSLSKSFSASLPSNAIVIYRKLSTIQMISEVAIANKNSDFATLGFDFSFLLTRSLSYNTLSQEGRRKNRGDGFFKRRGSHHDIHSHNHNHHSKYTRKNTHERYTDDDSKDDDEKERDITASGSADVNNTFNLDPDFDADFDATFHEGSTDSKVSTTDAFSSKGMFHE